MSGHSAEKDRPIIHKAGCGWETGPYCTCGADPQREFMDTTHDVKCWPEYFDAICAGRKQFEVRLNDRDYREGDALLLREYDPEADTFTGRLILAQIGYVLPLDSRGALGHVAFSLTGCVLPGNGPYVCDHESDCMFDRCGCVIVGCHGRVTSPEATQP